ncbi:MAG: DNA alkylation repair protein [Eubacteriaceae bacterium]|jgi:3-methyladenine DNA glycosylase AlkD|nr:DNA alkylation repair protein [Eubacteriaceae bacterium]
MEKLFEKLIENRNRDRAVQMAAYMRNQFPFLGIDATKRRHLSKDFIRETKKTKAIDWELVATLWEEPYREMQYIAVDYLNAMKNALSPEDLKRFEKLTVTKSWWDTVDGLDKLAGHIALHRPELDPTFVDWSLEDNIWLRRMAINHQRHRKEATREALLEEIVVNNLNQKEFFINKAIGWALREYSKTDSQWVVDFIQKYQDQMAKLSIQEGTRWIKNQK